MKRTERLKILSRPFEREIRADYFDDVVRGGDLLDCLRSDRSHARLISFASFEFESDAKLTRCGCVSNGGKLIRHRSSRAKSRDLAALLYGVATGFLAFALLRSE